MNVDEKNKPLKDAHNRPRFWYTKRDKYTDKATLEIAKGNDAVLGSIQLRFENAFYRVIQDLDQVKQLKKDKVL